MARSTTKDLRDKDAKQLTSDLEAAVKEYSETTRTNAAGELPNPLRIRKLRRDIARIKTVINEKNNESLVTTQGEEKA